MRGSRVMMEHSVKWEKEHTKTGRNHALVYSSVIFEVIDKTAHIKRLLFVSIKKIFTMKTLKKSDLPCVYS